MPPKLGVIQIGSEVRKRNKRGWRGTVREIHGNWADALWLHDQYPERISLAELEPLE